MLNVRLFVAMDIPEETRRALGALIERLRAIRSGARWVRVEGMHLTLKFIGEVAPEKSEAIQTALADVRSAAAVEMKFRGVGFFPNAKHPRVFWAGMEATPNLAEIAAEIEKRLEPLGIGREQRAFKPHLTLARFNSEQGLAELRNEIERAGVIEFGASSSAEFHLYESKLKPSGAEYRKVATILFCEKAQ